MLSNSALKIKEIGNEYIYVGEYNTLFEKNDLIEDVLSRISNYTDSQIIEELENKYLAEDLEEQISILRDWFAKVDKHREIINEKYEASQADWFGKKALNTLLMNVSHDCNLMCTYCYGDGGNYGKSKKLMTKEKAKEIIDYWFKYLNIDDRKISVVFFGGEPLMNKEIIKYSTEYINEYLSKYDKKANYSLTTNGTILDKELIEILVNNKFSITVSIDGGEEIHNKYRPTVSGKGSFERIKQNVVELKKYYRRLSARLTLTHDSVGSFAKAVKEIWDLGIQKVMYDMVSTQNKKLKLTEEDIEILRPQIEELSAITYESLLGSGDRIFKPLLSISKELHNKIFNPSCTYDSKKILAVDVDGVIFKCHRLSGMEEFNVGDISTGLDWDKYENQKKMICDKCWANNLCHKCAQSNIIDTGNAYKTDPIWCKHRKMLIIESIKLYIKINSNNPDLVDEIYSKF